MKKFSKYVLAAVLFLLFLPILTACNKDTLTKRIPVGYKTFDFKPKTTGIYHCLYYGSSGGAKLYISDDNGQSEGYLDSNVSYQDSGYIIYFMEAGKTYKIYTEIVDKEARWWKFRIEPFANIYKSISIGNPKSISYDTGYKHWTWYKFTSNEASLILTNNYGLLDIYDVNFKPVESKHYLPASLQAGSFYLRTDVFNGCTLTFEIQAASAYAASIPAIAENVPLSILYGRTWLKFTPNESGAYNFNSGHWASFNVYDASFTKITSLPNYPPHPFYLEANKTYYFQMWLDQIAQTTIVMERLSVTPITSGSSTVIPETPKWYIFIPEESAFYSSESITAYDSKLNYVGYLYSIGEPYMQKVYMEKDEVYYLHVDLYSHSENNGLFIIEPVS